MAQREIVISTESGSDLPAEVVKKYDFKVAPMHVIIGGEEFPDDTEHVDRVFNYFRSTGRVPSTSAVNVGEYDEFFTRLKAEHPGCVIYHFSYSSQASSTYAHAEQSIKNFDDVYLIDTKNVSGGCTAHMVTAAQYVREHQDSIEDYAAFADELQALADRIVCHFIPDTLEYLKAGGRVSNAAYLGASILKLHPLIEIDHDGRLIATKKYRGNMAKVARKFLPEFLERYDLDRQCLYLMYGKGLSQETLDYMKQFAADNGFADSIYVMTGCVISCHGGEGAIGLAGVLKEGLVTKA